jgi:putative DNA-invertase from lambdoid prophage Rac
MAEGKPLGRPKGSFSSPLDKYRPQIEEFLRKGVSVSSIAKILEVNYNTLLSYVRRRRLKRTI